MHLFFLLLLFVLSPAQAEHMSLSPDQQANLGIKFDTATPVNSVSSQRFPAEVVIPNSGQFIVHSSQDGVVLNLLKAEGDTVSKGETVAIINSPQLITAQSNYLQAISRLQQSQVDWQREKQLYEEGIIAERRYLETRTSYNQTRNHVTALEQQLKLSGMSEQALKKLRDRGEYDSHLSVVSEADGVIMKQQAKIGQRVTGMDKIYEVADLSTLWLEVHVPIDVARNISPGDRADVADRDVNAEVTTIGRQVHDIDQGVMVRASVNDHTALITPGEFVQVTFFSKQAENRYQVPQSAIIRLNGTPHIFVEQGEEITELPVTIESDNAGLAVIDTAGKPLGRIVVEGLAALKAVWQNQESP